jgi:hypothetical protein
MDLSQVKLSKTEWENIEIPVSEQEKNILTLICQGFHDPNVRINNNQSMLSFIKMDNTLDNELYLYKLYFEKDVDKLLKQFPDFVYTASSDLKNKKKEPKAVDKMKIDNMQKNIEGKVRHSIFEFLLFDFSKNILSTLLVKQHGFYLYSIIQFKKSSIIKINRYLQHFVDAVIDYANKKTEIMDIVDSAQDFIERNKYLLKYEDLSLFNHQKELFHLFNDKGNSEEKPNKTYDPKLVLYIAPTGTGKTLSPLGLSEGYKIIFVCVARHIGLSLAKSAVSIGKHIAFAFGCETASDVRLHNHSASSFTRNRKSGGIGKIDNTVGDKVEIMICDVKSYIVGMHYMLAYNKEEDIITYWDEPTITMDYEQHELHTIIHKNWVENKISKMVLSCATLPKEEEISATIADFQDKFTQIIKIEDDHHETIEPKIHTIMSYDCRKSISLLDKTGKCVLPHLLFPHYRDILKCVKHCIDNKTLLRYFDLNEIIRFVKHVNHNNDCIDNPECLINNWFKSISEITMSSLKQYYLELLRNIDPDMWEGIYRHLLSSQQNKFIGIVQSEKNIKDNENTNNSLRKIKSQDFCGVSKKGGGEGEDIRRFNSMDSIQQKLFTSECGILLTTQDAHTLTDGPTIFIVDDVLKTGKFYIQQSNIPQNVFDNIMNKIDHNNVIQEKMMRLEKNIEDELGKEVEKEKKMEKEQFTTNVRKMKSELASLQEQIKSIKMNEIFIPNSQEHQYKWLKNDNIVDNAFIPSIEEDNVKRIMMLEINNEMKILLLLGIGVFVNKPNVAYMEIMKSLAYNQKLYLIIASSDYIYGTNYQFCHGFIGKDLTNMTQQKTIQAMGRIGRGNIQQEYTVRFRTDEMLMSLFQPIERNLEAINMSTLFSS